jgi:hypothetical protein
LIHKFGKKDGGDFDAFIEELKKQPSPAVGELFIFVDECHRTQSGKATRNDSAGQRGNDRSKGIRGGHAPVLGLCRALLEAGYDPRRPLRAYRGDTVALKIRSIGEGAAYTSAGEVIKRNSIDCRR